jgi:hypothetical protein
MLKAFCLATWHNHPLEPIAATGAAPAQLIVRREQKTKTVPAERSGAALAFSAPVIGAVQEKI